MYRKRNQIYYPKENNNTLSFSGYLQFWKRRGWNTIDVIFHHEHYVICKHFGFQFTEFTGKFKKIESMENNFFLLECKFNNTNFNLCRVYDERLRRSVEL